MTEKYINHLPSSTDILTSSSTYFIAKQCTSPTLRGRHSSLLWLNIRKPLGSYTCSYDIASSSSATGSDSSEIDKSPIDCEDPLESLFSDCSKILNSEVSSLRDSLGRRVGVISGDDREGLELAEREPELDRSDSRMNFTVYAS